MMFEAAAVTAFVGIGSNIEPYRYVPQAVQLLRERFGELRVSTVYQCPAVGFDGADFLNLVVGFETGANIQALLQRLHCVESHCGRVRGECTASRTIDLDLLLYGDLVCDSEGLCLPREDILRYAFVLGPLAEIAPDARHPTDGRSFAQLWAVFGKGVRSLRRVDLVV